MHLASERSDRRSSAGRARSRFTPTASSSTRRPSSSRRSDRIALLQGDGPAALLTLQGSAAMGGGTALVFGGGKPGAPPARLFLDTAARTSTARSSSSTAARWAAAAGRQSMRGPEGARSVHRAARGHRRRTSHSVTLVIATPSGEVVERECPVGGSVTMEGKTGEVFTVVETRDRGQARARGEEAARRERVRRTIMASLIKKTVRHDAAQGRPGRGLLIAGGAAAGDPGADGAARAVYRKPPTLNVSA